MAANHQILIVDDIPSNLDILEEILTERDYPVFKASSGMEAVAMAQEQEFSLAMIDIVMPDIDGLETAKRIKQIPEHRNIPIIFLSALNKERRDMLKGFELGAFDYVVKPFDSLLLLSKVQVFCNMADQRKLLKKQNETLEKRNLELKEAIATGQTYQNELQKHQEHLEDIILQRTKDLIEAKQIAEDATKAKSEFLANISHELRTPMHQIIGFSKMGMDKAFKAEREKLHEYYAEIFTSSQRMHILQNNLLDLSMLESEEVIFNFQETSVSTLLKEVVDEFEKRAADEKIKVVLENLQNETSIPLDKDKVKQVIRNLITNAFEFSPAGGTINISLKDLQDRVEVRVRDRGKGIPEDMLIQVFNKFGKSDALKTTAGGAGLGLYLSNLIVSGHKGAIWAENNLDGGASIVFQLPCAQKLPKKKIGQLLIDKGYITKEQLEKELQRQQSE